MMTSAPAPLPLDVEEIRLDRDRRRLPLAYGGTRAEFSAERLRSACRCAACTADRARNRFPAAFPGVALTGVEPFGAHGLNLTFSDGHKRGVYPFAYLAALAAEAANDLPEMNP